MSQMNHVTTSDAGVLNMTAVTQETDQNYCPFKTQYCKNLDVVIDERIKQKKSTALHPWQVGLIVFGGVDPETNIVLESAFEEGFSRDGCRRAWELVGAAPLTRSCLNNKKVRKSIGDGTTDYQQLLLNIQDANDMATHALTAGGYDGNALKRTIVEIPSMQTSITEEDSKERYEVLVKSNTHRKLFSTLGGYHLSTSDDIFIKTEMSTREKEKKRLTIEKNKRLRKIKVEEKVKKILDTKGCDCTKWTKTDFDAVLAWYNPPNRTKLTTNEEKTRAWNDIITKGKNPPVYKR